VKAIDGGMPLGISNSLETG